MPVGLRLDPPQLTAAGGTDVDGAVILDNPADEAVHVRLFVGGEAAGWASIEPADLSLPAHGSARCELRFRLPRGAPGGVGGIPFAVRVLSDQEGQGGAAAEGTLEVIGQSELALRIMPVTARGTLSASSKVAVDNLGEVPARVQILTVPPDSAGVEVEPDSVIIEPGGTQFATVHIRPHARFFAGEVREHRYWVRIDPLGGARVSAEGAMSQRSLVAGLGPRVAAGAVALIVAVLAARAVFGGGSTSVATRTPLTTIATTTTTEEVTTTITTVAGQAPVTTTTIPLAKRPMAFVSKRDGNYEIYAASHDGANPVNLTKNPTHDSEPAWSPDATKIAFDSDRGGNFDVYVMNADGSNVVQLTNEPAPDGYPSWSPDGTKIAFTSFRDGNSEIYVMNADGTNQQRMTKNLADDSHPAWSPDGTKIAFQSDRDGNYEIYVMDADGANPQNLSNSPGADRDPAWSPNGARLAFDSTRDGGKAEIYLIGAEGKLPTRLTTNENDDSWPAWSRDGRAILFQSDRDADVELYEIAAGGGPQKRITNSPAEDTEPSW